MSKRDVLLYFVNSICDWFCVKSPMLIATWNVNSIMARLPLVMRWLRDAAPDVICLQETKCPDARFPHAELAEVGYKAETFGGRVYNGVAILSRASLGEVEDVRRGFPDNSEDTQPRLIAGTVAGVRVVNVYIPNGSAIGTDKYEYKLQWLDRLGELFNEFYGRDELVLLCGDFNVAPDDRDVHDPVFWRNRVLVSDEERERIEALKEWGFVDAYRLHVNEGENFSWWDYRGGDFRRNAGLRIDHIFVTEPLAGKCTRAWIDAAPRAWERPSDHTPVVAEFSGV